MEGVRDVECIFPDVSGYPRGKLMPADAFAEGQELKIAQAVAMQCVTGEYPEDAIFPDEDPDVRLEPDLRTLHRAPWASRPRYVAVHDCVELTGELCQFAPRTVLKNVLARYAAKGLKPVVAPEIEFYLTAACTDPTQKLRPPMGRAGQTEVGQSAFSLNMLNSLAPFWDEFRLAQEALGIRADTWIHEVGTTQYEINLLHGDPVAVADQAFLFKYAAKEIALQHGMNAVFMAKPLEGQAGSSMHLHQSVVDAEGQNVFSDARGDATPAFLQFIAGQQRYVPELMLVFAPFVNSFRRYVSGSQAPINLEWGHENRTTGLRVPTSSPAARRVENRLAGADANPYLVIAASLAAGLAGIEEGLTPSAPLEGSGYGQAHRLPRTFQHALESLQGSEHAPRLMGESFVRAYLAVKDMEHAHYQAEISAWERRFLLPQA